MKKSRICWIRILFPVLSVLLFSIFLLTIKVNAAGDSSDPLPFRKSSISTYQNYFVNYPDSLTTIQNFHNVSELDDYTILIYENSENSSNIYIVSILITNDNVVNFAAYDSSNSSISINDFDSYRSDYFIYGSALNGHKWKISKSTGVLTSGSSTSVSLSDFQVLGDHNPSDFGLTYCYPIDINGTVSLFDHDIFTDTEPAPDIVSGQATRPDKQERMDFLHNNRPDHVPEAPTPTSYTWITYNPPAIDTSTMEDTLISILDRMQYNFSYLFDNIGGLFSNLISNIGSYLEYLGDLIAYGFDLVVNNIIAGIENFYDNMVSLIEPLVNTVNNIGSFVAAFYALGLDQQGNFAVGQMFTSLFVPSTQEFLQAFIEHDDFDFIGVSKVVMADAPRILSQIYNVIPSPIFHVPSCTFHGVEIGNFDISFSWYTPYKVYVDTIVSAFLVIGYLYWIFISLHSHLRSTYQPLEDPVDHSIPF